jgi:glucosamine--fructose-6-phosphate aminotransferase (isomerizing)
MTAPKSNMRREIEEIPVAVERLLTHQSATVAKAARQARALEPRFLLSVARGSSDHVCTYLKYVSELQLGLPMASLGPSVQSVYGRTIKAKGALCVSVSQSGQSPDIVDMTRSVAASGARTVAITNYPQSPLALSAATTLPIEAGPEHSVAATKTFVNSLVNGVLFLAEMAGDAELIRALNTLPEHLDRAIRCDWSAFAAAIDGPSLYTLGRGPAWAISNEAALKFKETCQLHAESYSSAEVMHGPVSIVDQSFPVLVFAAGDAAETGVAETADALAAKGARVFATTDKVTQATALPHIRTDHGLTDSIASMASFYALAEAVAVTRGINPDTPRHLNKVTETV